MGPGCAERRKGRCTASGTRAERTLAPCDDLPVGQFCVESPLQKYFRSHSPQITSRTFRIPPHRGALAIVTNAGRDAVDAAAFCARRDCRANRKIRERSTARGREMLQRTAKSCGPDAPTLASSSRRLRRPYRARTSHILRKRRWQKSPVTEES